MGADNYHKMFSSPDAFSKSINSAKKDLNALFENLQKQANVLEAKERISKVIDGHTIEIMVMVDGSIGIKTNNAPASVKEKVLEAIKAL